MGICKNVKEYFSQGVMLKHLMPLYANTRDGDKIFKEVRGGICYMLSIEWLRSIMIEHKNVEDVFDIDLLLCGAEPQRKEVMAYYKQIANNFYNYVISFKNAYGGEYTPGAAELTANHFVFDIYYADVCSAGKFAVIKTYDSNDGPIALEDIIQSKPECALLVRFNMLFQDRKENFGHAVALWKTGAGIYFFDPNYGVFSITQPGRLIADITDYYKWTGTILKGVKFCLSEIEVK